MKDEFSKNFDKSWNKAHGIEEPKKESSLSDKEMTRDSEPFTINKGKDVKECIRRLKEELMIAQECNITNEPEHKLGCQDYIHYEEAKEIIDKLSGDKLI